VSISAIDADKDEGTDTSGPVTPTEFTFEVSRSGKSQEAFSVKYAVAGSGTHPANVPDDFIGLTTDTLHFAENEPSKRVTIHVAPDDLDEDDEGFLVTLSDPTNDFQIGQPDAAFGLIRNDDDLVFSIAPQNASQPEGDKKTTDFTFTVTRGGNVHAGEIECSVDWAVTVGSSGGPMGGSGGRLRWAHRRNGRLCSGWCPDQDDSCSGQGGNPSRGERDFRRQVVASATASWWRVRFADDRHRHCSWNDRG
jgi:hypothetical protein